MASFQQYKKQFVATPRGMAIAANAIAGAELGLYELKAVRDLFREAYKTFRSKDPTTTDIELFIDELRLKAEDCNWFDSRTSSITNPGNIGYMCVIKDARPPRDWLDADWGKILKRTPRLPSPSDAEKSDEEQWVQHLQGRSSRTFSLKPGKSFGYGLTWLTPYNELMCQLATTSYSKAITARDKLGLGHHRPKTHLVLYRIPITALDHASHARPTFAEALTKYGYFFCTQPNGSQQFNDRHFGYTVDLAMFRDRSILSNGLKERVCRPINGQHINPDEIYVEYLGRVESPCGDDTENLDFFWRKLAAGRDFSKL